jgi:hypothetical protein
MISFVKICSVVLGIMTFPKVPIPFAITAIHEFYMASSLYFITFHETLLGLLHGILEKKSELKRSETLAKSCSIHVYGLLYGQSILCTQLRGDSLIYVFQCNGQAVVQPRKVYS